MGGAGPRPWVRSYLRILAGSATGKGGKLGFDFVGWQQAAQIGRFLGG